MVATRIMKIFLTAFTQCSNYSQIFIVRFAKGPRYLKDKALTFTPGVEAFVNSHDALKSKFKKYAVPLAWSRELILVDCAYQLLN